MYWKLIYWFLFNVIMALMPIFFNWLYRLMNKTSRALTILLGRGELFIVSAIIVATATGKLLTTVTNLKFQGLAGFFCVILIMVSCGCFAYVSSDEEGALHPTKIRNLSITIFIFSVIASGSSFVIVGG